MSTVTSTTSAVSRGFDVYSHFRSVMDDLGLSPEDTGGTRYVRRRGSDFPERPPARGVHRHPDHGRGGGMPIPPQRTGRRAGPEHRLRRAITASIRYKFMPTVNRYPYQLPYWVDNPMGFDLYLTRDSRWFLPTRAYPRLLHRCARFCGAHRTRTASPTPCPSGTGWTSRGGRRQGAGLRGLPLAEESANHPQGEQLADRPLVEIVKIGECDPEPFSRPRVRWPGCGCWPPPTSLPAT